MANTDFHKRWAPILQNEPWWEKTAADYVDAYECQHEYERTEPIEALVYQLAKAIGYNTTQECPKCDAIVDTTTCFGEYTHCAACVEKEQREHEEEMARRAAAEAAYQAMTPAQRAEVDARMPKIMLAGLIRRNVQ